MVFLPRYQFGETNPNPLIVYLSTVSGCSYTDNRPKYKDMAPVVGFGKGMHCPECSWWQSWDDDPTVYCNFCGALFDATTDDPPEAQEAIEEARE